MARRRRRKRKKLELKGDEIQLVTFTLGNETYAVDVHKVRLIGRVEEITNVPRLPDFIEGVMNLRGQATTVIDLRTLFRIKGDVKPVMESRIIVVEVQKNQLGLIVDNVRDVVRVSPTTIFKPPQTISINVDIKFLKGVCMLPEEIIMLLDLDLVLSEDQMHNVFELSSKNQMEIEFMKKIQDPIKNRSVEDHV